MQSDPLSALVADSVRAAIAEELPTIVAALREAMPTPQPPSRPDRFAAMGEIATVLGCDRSTVIRRVENGSYPPLTHQGRNVGWPISTLMSVLGGTGDLPPPVPKRLRGQNK